MGNLYLHLLGTFRAELDGAVVTGAFRTKKERALLAYLAVESSRPYRREALAELLWPERPEGYARTNLRQALLGLRRVLGQGLLMISEETICLNRDMDLRLDIKDFQRLIRSTLEHTHRKNQICPNCAKAFQQAVALYRGDFLEDIAVPDSHAYQEWVVYQREQYYRNLILAIRNLGDYYLNLGDYEQAYTYAWRYVNLAPLEEAAHRQLMSLLAISGRRSAALEQYHACEQILKRELGVKPSPETRDLYEKISSSSGLSLQPALHPVELTNLPVMLTSFVGRDKESERLRHCMTNPACRLMTMVGVPGIGKTRLAIQAASQSLKEFADGVWFVSLEKLRTAEQVAEAIFQAMSQAINPGDDLKVQLHQMLRPLNTLLILDPFDHLVQETDFLVDLLQNAPGLKLLVTSTSRLNTQAACVFDIRGLPYPEGEAPESESVPAAVQLFLARAQQNNAPQPVDKEYLAKVSSLCRKLDGMPLAIELAAASLKKYSLDELILGFQSNLEFLETTAYDLPHRHRNLRMAFTPAWEALAEKEKVVLRKLATLTGEFSLEEARAGAKATPAILASLVDRSMLGVSSPGRYELHPLLRLFVAGETGAPAPAPPSQPAPSETPPAVPPDEVMPAGLTGFELFWDRLTHMIARSSRRKYIAALIVLEVMFENCDPAATQRTCQAGMRVLAQRLLKALRRGDTVARTGERRFLILLEDLSRAEDSQAVAQKLLDALGKRVNVDERVYRLQISLGVAVFPDDATNADALLARAEQALAAVPF